MAINKKVDYDFWKWLKNIKNIKPSKNSKHDYSYLLHVCSDEEYRKLKRITNKPKQYGKEKEHARKSN